VDQRAIVMKKANEITGGEVRAHVLKTKTENNKKEDGSKSDAGRLSVNIRRVQSDKTKKKKKRPKQMRWCPCGWSNDGGKKKGVLVSK